MLARTRADWVEALTRADVPFGRVNSLPDLLTDPHLEGVGFWQTREHPTEGTLRVPSPSIAMSASPPSVRSLPPRLNEHGAQILAELGLAPPTPAG